MTGLLVITFSMNSNHLMTSEEERPLLGLEIIAGVLQLCSAYIVKTWKNCQSIRKRNQTIRCLYAALPIREIASMIFDYLV